MTQALFIVGPTGSGKTHLAIQIAKEFDGEIINADSRQIYKDLNIGTAKPTSIELNSFPHHLFDHWPLTFEGNADLYQQEAFSLILEINNRKKLPIIVGGTGLYHRALIYGFFESKNSDPSIRKKYENILKERGVKALYDLLSECDPKASEMIHPHHSSRILRALEVFESTGVSIIDHQENHKFENPRFDYLKIGIDINRDQLYENINQRVKQMIEVGLEEEVSKLFEKYNNDEIVLRLLNSTIGYQEWDLFFDGKINLEEVISVIQKNTRNFAKRQMTWFRKEDDINWFLKNDIESMFLKIRDWLSI